MNILLLMWSCFTVAELSKTHWKDYRGRLYVVEKEKLDFATSMERCFDEGGVLANFTADNDIGKFIVQMGLGRNGRYWISDGEVDYFFRSCVALAIQRQRKSWIKVSSNCSSVYPFICQKEAPKSVTPIPEPTTISPNSTLSDCDSNQAFSEATTADCKGKLKIVPSSRLMQAANQSQEHLQPSFRTDEVLPSRPSEYLQIHPALFPLFSSLKPASSSTGFESVTPLVTENPEGQNTMATKSYLSYYHQNLTQLCQLCLSQCSRDLPSNNLNSSDKKSVDFMNKTLVVDVKSTNRYRRQLTSAEDHRTSSKAMGVAAVLIITAIFLSIVAMDAPLLLHDLKTLMAGLYDRIDS